MNFLFSFAFIVVHRIKKVAGSFNISLLNFFITGYLYQRQGQEDEYDFKGGAGAASVNKQVVHKSGFKYVEDESPDTELENDLSDDKNNLKDMKETAQIRHSGRTAGKTFKYYLNYHDCILLSLDVDASKTGGPHFIYILQKVVSTFIMMQITGGL